MRPRRHAVMQVYKRNGKKTPFWSDNKDHISLATWRYSDVHTIKVIFLAFHISSPRACLVYTISYFLSRPTCCGCPLYGYTATPQSTLQARVYTLFPLIKLSRSFYDDLVIYMCKLPKIITIFYEHSIPIISWWENYGFIYSLRMYN
jgi:hypothetical protein